MIGSVIICRGGKSSEPVESIFTGVNTDDDIAYSGVVFRCRICKNPIATEAHILSVNGAHKHTFANPHGKVFEIGCFSAAPGCRTVGQPSRECTWFAGCSWSYSLCSKCRNHIGWKYQSDISGIFWGLVLVELIS